MRTFGRVAGLAAVGAAADAAEETARDLDYRYAAEASVSPIAEFGDLPSRMNRIRR